VARSFALTSPIGCGLRASCNLLFFSFGAENNFLEAPSFDFSAFLNFWGLQLKALIAPAAFTVYFTLLHLALPSKPFAISALIAATSAFAVD